MGTSCYATKGVDCGVCLVVLLLAQTQHGRHFLCLVDGITIEELLRNAILWIWNKGEV
jgi:hypothetical protein